jgi:3-deoxy-7-phosphoheptulonate synthase
LRKGNTVNRTDPILDRHILEVVPLVSPRTVREAVPLTRENEGLVRTSRDALADVLDGRDDRVVVVVGPCSVHDTDAALEYACRLEELARELREDLIVVMRVYFEKPRTTVGWKGLVNDPRLDGSHHVDEGLMVARRLLVAILSLGLPVGCEFLDPTTPHYIADAVSWGAIGARTSQSQVHRQLASGLSMPVGFKNSTDGGVQSAVDGVSVAARPQSFLGVDDDGSAAVISTSGNPDCHVVLRGSDAGPNYAKSDVEDALERLSRAGLRQRIVIDASHGNSGKDHRRQAAVAREIAERISQGEPGLAGVMLESFLLAGRQDLAPGNVSPLRYGQSITDSCIGWDETSELLVTLARAVSQRRAT